MDEIWHTGNMMITAISYTLLSAMCHGVKQIPAPQQTMKLAPVATVHPKCEKVADDYEADILSQPIHVQ